MLSGLGVLASLLRFFKAIAFFSTLFFKTTSFRLLSSRNIFLRSFPSNPQSTFNKGNRFSLRFSTLSSMSTLSNLSINPSQIANYSDSFERDIKFYHELRNCSDHYISKPLNRALDTFYDSLRLYGPDRVFSSYNGGKDADVIMHLLRASYAKYSLDQHQAFRPKLIYFSNPDEFEEVESHIALMKKQYDLEITDYDCGIIEGLKRHIETVCGGAHAAFALGTRKGDPNCHDQQVFAPSSSWMPVPFMRVNPIIDWEYGHVWHFLRIFKLPYCSLYDQGYTSLGKKSQTFPNEALLRKFPKINSDGSQEKLFLPAYMLSDWTLERSGRTKPIEDIRPPNTITEEPENSNSSHIKSAAILVIGDEILNGLTSESNLQVASTTLATIGIPVRTVSIVSDDVEQIAREALRLSQEYDIVISSGGIGPTHDDVTLKALSQALHQEMKPHKEMIDHLNEIESSYADELSASSKETREGGESMKETFKRLAVLPENSHLLFPPPPDDYYVTSPKANLSNPSSPLQSPEGSSSSKFIRRKNWPILKCDNIYVLPGIPKLFERKIQLLAKHFLMKNANKVLKTTKIILDIEERNLVVTLDSLVSRYTDVKIGSYPFVDHPEFKTIITFQCAEDHRLQEAVMYLLKELPSRAVVRVERVIPNQP